MRVPAVRAKARPPECELPHGRPRPTVLCCRRTSRGCPMRRREIKGKKRHILVDTLGLLLHAIVHPADIQDRDGGILLLATLFGMYPFLKTLFADGGYQGPELTRRSPGSCRSSKRKSSNAPIMSKDLWCFHAVGLSSAPLLGSTAAEGLSRTGRTSIARRWRSCASHQSVSCSENFVIRLDVPGRTLTGWLRRSGPSRAWRQVPLKKHKSSAAVDEHVSSQSVHSSPR
jgi:Transposase DDE domain